MTQSEARELLRCMQAEGLRGEVQNMGGMGVTFGVTTAASPMQIGFVCSGMGHGMRDLPRQGGKSTCGSRFYS